jgi:hypothetical protein
LLKVFSIAVGKKNEGIAMKFELDLMDLREF